MRTIKLGDQVKDEVSGLVGIAVAVVNYLHGNVRYGVQSKVKEDGSPGVLEYFDASQLRPF